jgi:hypothetical protein
VNRAKTLALIDVSKSRGLEIGPQSRPVVTKEMGPVEYVDRASTEELRRWYANDPAVKLADLVEVDHVWGENGRTLLDCVGGRRAYDYVIASHVLEHVPDLLGWLDEVAAVLVDGGIASFFIPDQRFTFDILRHTSTRAELVDAYLRKLRRPDTRQIFDHFNNHRDVGSEAIKSGRTQPQDLPPQHHPRELMEICRRAMEGAQYIDAHCWVFTPQSFVTALDFASELGLLPFEIASAHPTARRSDEFFVSLRRLAEALTQEERRTAFVASRERLALPPEDARLVELNELKHRLATAEAEIGALRRSTSWRVTAPLRRAASLWRRGSG